MTKEGLQGVFVCCLLMGAANVQAQASRAPAAGEVTLAMNVRGGAYQQLEMPLSEHDHGDVFLSIDSVNKDPQWGATSNLCVLGKPHSDQVCLRFGKLGKEAEKLTAMKVLVREDGKALLSSETLSGSYRIGETIKVGVRVSPKMVEFTINGGEPMKRQLTFSPRILRMGCSSALCTYRVQ